MPKPAQNPRVYPYPCRTLLETAFIFIQQFVFGIKELCQDLFRSTLKPVEKVLCDSKINKANIHKIVLVGGSTRIPRIFELVSDFFNDNEPSVLQGYG